MRSTANFLAAFLCLCAVATAVEPQTLLNVSRGELPNDTAQGNVTKITLRENHPELGGKALEIVFGKGDAFGVNRTVAVKDWRSFEAVEFSVFNPAQGEVRLTFTVRHRGTTSYPTRVDLPVALKPGRNQVRLPVAGMKNVDGSAPDLSQVNHWYLAAEPEQAPTLYFGDFWLLGREGRPAATATKRTAPIRTDPARLARIKRAKMPKITRPVLFHTPEADAILSALEVFPPEHAINQLVDQWPVHPNSRQIVASIGADKPLRYNPDMAFILVPPDQKRVDVKIVEYPDESDPGPYPIPENIPIEGWPVHYQREQGGRITLEQVQRRPPKYEGDRHAIVVDPTAGLLYEFFTFGKTSEGWAAGQASIFNLKTGALRPEGWTSADAAGLPIFPTVVRYDELKRGMVEHALRVTVRRSRRAYVHPATHYASDLEDENLPRMGERLRLRADFDTRPFSQPVQAILKGLKRYGMLVADNGIEWAISVAPDPRIPVLHSELRRIKGSDFEVVVAPE